MHHPSSFLIALLITAMPAGLRAAGDKNSVPSTLRSATVYRTGAELVHTATATLNQGNNELTIDDISNKVDPTSIRVSCTGNTTIMSMTFSTEYLKPESVSPYVKKLQDSVESIRRELAALDALTKSDNEVLDLLNANKTVAGTNGLTVTELSKIVDYYKQKSIELRSELNAYHERSVKWNRLLEKLENQVKEEEKKNGRTAGRLLLQLLSPMAGACDFTISYLTTSASWSPFYDLKVDNATDPLRILYKARLSQTSGLDWKKIKLSLSTSTPGRDGNAPVMKTWFLQFVEREVLRVRGANSYSNTLAGSVAGVQARSNGLDDVVVAGYGSALSDYVAVNDNQMDVTFDIDLPYDVPGNGKEQGVVLKEYKVPCSYRYYAAPRLDKDAYLLGEVPGWEKLNLLPGEANIIVEGTLIGKSYIDPGSIQDTLNLTLGRDKRIVVKKEKIADYSSVKFLGANKKQVFTYEITVRNNKKEKVELLLKDQHPLSSSKDIEEELLQSAGAEVNAETGVLTWKLQLAPGESRKFRISYSVKYPKDKTVNL